jgi:hypothetical protein
MICGRIEIGRAWTRGQDRSGAPHPQDQGPSHSYALRASGRALSSGKLPDRSGFQACTSPRHDF